jgi:hypothetical protein
MLKRLLIGLISISVVAMIWPAADVQAGCELKHLAGGWCYYCPSTSYSVSGTAITPDQCLYWWPGSAMNRIILKFLPTDVNKCEGDECPTCVSAVFGLADKYGNHIPRYPEVLDFEAYTALWVFCCPPGHTDPKSGECLDPVWSSGQPGFHQGFEANAAQFTYAKKRVSQEDVEVSFPPLCPNKNWYVESYPIDFNGVTCCCPRGFDKVGDGYKCCYERDANGKCVEGGYEPRTGEGAQSIDQAAMVLHCEEWTNTFDAFDNCDNLTTQESGSFQVPTGFCNELYTKFMTQ